MIPCKLLFIDKGNLFWFEEMLNLKYDSSSIKVDTKLSGPKISILSLCIY